MMSVRELQILGEEREEKDRTWCRESLLAFGLGLNVSTVQLHSYIRGAFALKHTDPSPSTNQDCRRIVAQLSFVHRLIGRIHIGR